MAQEQPSRILYAQAIQLIQKLQQLYSTTKNQTPQQTSESINSILSRFSSNAGKALTQYEPVVLSEIPLSSKMNRFWSSLQDDINILEDQIDVLNASTIFSHNFIKTEILKAQKENNKLQNKIKTLEMYSSVDNASLVYFGDAFITEDFVDWDLVPAEERASFLSKGYVSLKVKEEKNVADENSGISILGGSNGFMGNNQEIIDAQDVIINPSNGQKMYEFISETNRSANLKMITDSKPTTWFEFEKYFVPVIDRAKVKNHNFDYILNNNSAVAYLMESSSNVATGTPISWADGLPDGVLRLILEIDLKSNQQVNVLSLLPYGLVDNKNNPIKISLVATSLDRTDWSILNPENVWIANGVNKQISNIDNENILIGSATWVTDGSLIRYIRFEIEQPQSVSCSIGHTYYVSKDGPAVEIPNYFIDYPAYDASNMDYNADIPYNAAIGYGGLAPGSSNQDVAYDNVALDNANQNRSVRIVNDYDYRVLGPIPPATNPQLYMDLKNATVNGLIQKVEVFSGKRWAIGIRDINIKQNIYDTTGIIVSKKFNIPGIIDRVSIEADISIPTDYDTSVVWIKFYVSPNDGANWYQISRIQDDFLDIPEILAFNDPTPRELRESGVAYHDVKGTVDSLRVKIEITRPDDKQSSTPVVRSYKLKIIKRDSQ